MKLLIINETIFDDEYVTHRFTDSNQNSKEGSIMVDCTRHKTTLRKQQPFSMKVEQHDMQE